MTRRANHLGFIADVIHQQAAAKVLSACYISIINENTNQYFKDVQQHIPILIHGILEYYLSMSWLGLEWFVGWACMACCSIINSVSHTVNLWEIF